MAEGDATTSTEEGKSEDEKKSEEKTATEGKSEEAAGKTDDEKLGPEGVKALEAFKNRARAAEKREKELAERLDKIEESNKSESEKALDKARKEARKEAEAEFEKERRSDRLQVAVAKHARELADVDDVVLNLERADTDGLFNEEGRVNDKALEAALEELLKSKPHLKASGAGKPPGSADGGEGEGGGAVSMNDLIRGRIPT